MKSLTVRAIPSDNSQKHPPVPSEVLPQHPFSMGIIAPKGSGKTTLIGNMIHFYKNYFHAIIIFSPTLNNDEKWVWIRKQKLLGKNTALEQFIKEGSKKRKRDDEQTATDGNTESFLIHDNEDFDGKILEDHIYDKYQKSDLREILDDQQKLSDYISKHCGGQVLKNRILFIFDDLVGSVLFSREKTNPFTILNSNMRHYNASILMVTQAYKEIPKTVRTNFSAMVLFEIPSNNEKKVIQEEYGMGLDKKQWERVYNYCTGEDHSFLFYNTQKQKKRRIMKNFSEIINVMF